MWRRARSGSLGAPGLGLLATSWLGCWLIPPAVGTIRVDWPEVGPAGSPGDPLDAYGDNARCRLLDELDASVVVRRPHGDGTVGNWRIAAGRGIHGLRAVCPTDAGEPDAPRTENVEPGEYKVTVKAKCQPDREYVLQVGEDGARVDTRVRAPEQRRAFVNVKREPVLVVPFSERRALKPSAKVPGYLPENTEVEIVRMWPR